MATGKIDLKFYLDTDDFKKMVVLTCKNENCFHNQCGYPSSFCNLKHIIIGVTGDCKNFIEKGSI